MRVFNLIKQESVFCLRIFSSAEIYITELPKPFERSLEYEWNAVSAGGGRYIKDPVKGRVVENASWPINPQYLLRFANSISLKIILRKVSGHLSR